MHGDYVHVANDYTGSPLVTQNKVRPHLSMYQISGSLSIRSLCTKQICACIYKCTVYIHVHSARHLHLSSSLTLSTNLLKTDMYKQVRSDCNIRQWHGYNITLLHMQGFIQGEEGRLRISPLKTIFPSPKIKSYTSVYT